MTEAPAARIAGPLHPAGIVSPNGNDLTVGTSATQLNTTGIVFHVLDVQADPSNSGDVKVGSQAFPNIILQAGGTWTFYDVSPNQLWCVGTAAGQVVHWQGHGFHQSDEVWS